MQDFGCQGRSAPTDPTVTFYPNPTSGAVEIQADKSVHYQWLKAYDAQGNLRFEQQSTSAEGIRSFNLQTLKEGIYQVQLFDGKQLTSQRLKKE